VPLIFVYTLLYYKASRLWTHVQIWKDVHSHFWDTLYVPADRFVSTFHLLNNACNGRCPKASYDLVIGNKMKRVWNEVVWGPI